MIDLLKDMYQDNIKLLNTTMHLAYETINSYQNLWFKLLEAVSLPELGSEKRHRGDEIEGIQQKANSFLYKLYNLVRDDQSKQCNMYKIGKLLGYGVHETEKVVEILSRGEPISHKKSSDKVGITPYAIMIIKGEITVGYAPIH